MNKLILFFAGSVLGLSLSAQQLRSIPMTRVGVISDNVGAADFAAADVNGDGIQDIISCSNGAPFAVSSNNSGTSFSTVWMGPGVGCTGVAAGDLDGDGGTEVVVTTSAPGKILIFDPRSLAVPTGSIALPDSAAGSDVAVGNVDSDPGLEIVVTTASNTYVFDAATHNLKWTAASYGGRKVQLGDVDGDGRLDIVVNGPTGWVLDAQTHTTKFGYVGGFGVAMAVGDVDNDGKAEIVFSSVWQEQLTILNADTMQTSSVNGTSSPYVECLAIADANGDGSVEIITGNNQWGSIEGHRPSDGALLWSINNPESGVQGIAAADVTGDGRADVIWGAGHSSSGQDVLFVGNAVSKNIAWQCVDLDGPFFSAVGDVDRDGRMDFVVASAASQSYYSGSVVEVFDLATGVSKGKLSLGQQSSYETNRLLVAQTDYDAAGEIVTGGEDWYDPQIFVWDGVTRNSEFKSAVSSPSFITSTLVSADIDHDGVDELIVGQSDSKVIVLAGASNFIQNAVPVSGTINAQAIADVDGDGVLDLVVGTSTTLYVFNTATWAAEGQLALSGGVSTVAATSGFVAARTNDGVLHLYGSAALDSAWTCSTTALGTTGTSALGFSHLGGATWLLAGDEAGNLRLLPTSGATCPTFTTTKIASTSILRIGAADVTGDGREELVIDTNYASEIDLVGLSTESRGDVNGDGVVNANDVEALGDFIFAKSNGITPAADVNADQRISAEDLFSLIAYQYAGGAAPVP